MKKMISILVIIIIAGTGSRAATPVNYHLMVAPGSLTDNAVTLLWDKQHEVEDSMYIIELNGVMQELTPKTNCTLKGLNANTVYTVGLFTRGKIGFKPLGTIKFKTSSKGKLYNILDYGATDDTLVSNTKAIQAAINACTEGGTVYIPKGIFVTGALFLKSNMTLYIEKGGVLKGSGSVEDYLPMIMNRFEGWEMKTYASLLNAGTLNRDGTYNVKNLRITGKGTLSGGGKELGEAMINASGYRSRGRLICLMNCQNVDISGITLTNPPAWTLHYIYSDNISCHDLNIVTYGVMNGDGIDPDSSTDSYIFNCTFDTGDDCIAIKSGKNPEGFYVAKPTTNVRITNCDFVRGHGISIGSEMSGGVSDVLVQDCKAGALYHGMQIKGTKERGGYVKNVTVTDCELMQITVFSQLSYNNDGEAAPEPPTFENFVFKNIDLSAAVKPDQVIDINGFKDPAHKLKSVLFENIILPANAKVIMNDAEKVKFVNVKAVDGSKPGFVTNNCNDIQY